MVWIKHVSHGCHLERFRLSSVRMRSFTGMSDEPCGLCNCVDFPGEDNGYGCFGCRYFIHKACAELPIRMEFHPLHAHDDHSLLLSQSGLLPATASTATCCYYCDERIEKGLYSYGCNRCSNFYMHVACAAIPLPTIKMSQSDRVARFACHLQAMTLIDYRSDCEQRLVPPRAFMYFFNNFFDPKYFKGFFFFFYSSMTQVFGFASSSDDEPPEDKCFACQSPWSGPAYCCTASHTNCKIFLHKSCAELPERIQHPLDSRHSLQLQVSKPRSCDVCDRRDCRLIYCCSKDGCKINLCVEYAFRMVVKCLSHDHALCLMEEPSWHINCDGCRRSYKNWPDFKSTVEVKSTQRYLFRCLKGDFNLHFLCGPLPTSVKYEFHIHRLSLVDHSSIEDDSDEYYCDACEQERDPFFRVYYCKECKYVAHIHCVISEVYMLVLLLFFRRIFMLTVL